MIEIFNCATPRPRGGQVTHGCTHAPEYRVWAGMHQRCGNPKNVRYSRYGGRGISVCEQWSDFACFLEDMGKRPSKDHSLDRYPDNDGNYEPGNCRWATRSQQQQNKATYPENNRLPRGDNHWTRKDRERARAMARRNITHTHKRGADNHSAKLTQDAANAMRRAYIANPSVTMTHIGRQFGVGRETARKVIKGIAWL